MAIPSTVNLNIVAYGPSSDADIAIAIVMPQLKETPIRIKYSNRERDHGCLLRLVYEINKNRSESCGFLVYKNADRKSSFSEKGLLFLNDWLRILAVKR